MENRKKIFFISHAIANANIAKILDEAVKSTSENVTTFIASRAGDIRVGKSYFDEIESALQKAHVYIIILTPESISRPWVNFESGVAWFFERRRNRKLIFVRINALATDDIPLPIQTKQISPLDDAEHLAAIFKEMDLPLKNISHWADKFADEASKYVTTNNEPAWEGISHQDTYYAWAGPLLGLDDKDFVSPPRALINEITRHGYIPRWTNLNKISSLNERGYAQVFATDQENWRRPVVDRGLYLMVRFQTQPFVQVKK